MAVVALFGEMIKSIIGYSIVAIHYEIADVVLRIGEPFVRLAFVIMAYVVFTANLPQDYGTELPILQAQLIRGCYIFWCLFS